MPLADLLTRPIGLRYRVDVLDEAEQPVTDDDGQPVTTEATVPAFGYVRQIASEVDESVRIESADLRVYVPAATDVDNLLGVAIDDAAFDLVSVPLQQWNPRTQSYEYVAFTVRRAVS